MPLQLPWADKDYFTVAQVNGLARELIEENFADVRILGEVSNFRRHSSGHLYFSLKDNDAQIGAVCFRGDARRVDFEVADGVKVLAGGRLTVYEPQGRYQIVVRSLRRHGAGELELAFRALKGKLESEGLFDPAAKKPLPRYPFRIAVVTSSTGAAVRDVVSTLRRRWPCVEIVIVPVRVQGESAAGEITRALDTLDAASDVDVIIVGRGGGSLEDLWAFNEEEVARAIFRCRAPVISAVGHETDFTIADFVADVRAATPTMAAEIAVPEMTDVLNSIARTRARLVEYARALLDAHGRRVRELLGSYALGRVRGTIGQYIQRHDYATERLRRRIAECVHQRERRLEEALIRLRGLDPGAIMRRGYAICADYESGRVVASVEDAVSSDDLRVTFHDGAIRSSVKEKLDGN